MPADAAAALTIAPARGFRAEGEVRIRDLRVAADIGINPEELGRRQPLVISVTLALAALPGDRIEQSIDYRRVAGLAEALAAERIGLIERFAERLAVACLREPAVRRAEVIAEKPQALANGVASVRVVLERG